MTRALMFGTALMCSAFTQAGVVEVHVGSYYYEPQFASVQPGDTVLWIWDGPNGGNHDVTSGAGCSEESGLFYSPITEAVQTYEWTVPASEDGGVVPYYCSVGNHCVAGNQFGGLMVNVGAMHFVSTNGFAFEPAEITVQAGDVVVWIHGGGTHTVTSGTDCVSDGRFDSPLDNFNPMPFYVVPNDEPTGTIDYYCIPHCGMAMTGKINVVGTEPVGACCFMAILCDENMTEDDCLWGDPDYTWYEGMTCDEADCLVLGSCCMDMGGGNIECLDVVQEDCAAGGGEWMGWMSCDEVSCQDCPEDVDGNGSIDVDDLLSLLSTYGQSCADCPQDVNGSGAVDVDDLLQLLGVYGTDC